ncbi:HipA domain-containing protein [uncultured Pseudokineococcus sp.]|uniref:HipA domain-containing protein n=1 Tax=uncultured Pseudokineococcus sp. TaxID=1642928 RepID=UPI00262F9FFD|nr:HipA domain-containing protein [uncultured Pseudokineococcus sp.]
MAHASVRDVSAWEVAGFEAMGSSGNTWLRDAADERWLFKPNRVHENGHEEGEDWAEALACSVARLLGVPAAHAEVASRDGRRGAVSRDIVTAMRRREGWELHAGLVLLGGSVDREAPKEVRHAAHTLDAVLAVLHDVAPPDEVSGTSAGDVFAGYLLLDALISNQDRHEENWAVLARPSGELVLAPTYDHGASMGFQLTDGKRLEILTGRGVESYVRRARASKMGDGKARLLDVVRQALERCGAAASEQWVGRLGDISEDDLAAAVDGTPAMSDPARTFSHALLTANRRRLLDAHG